MPTYFEVKIKYLKVQDTGLLKKVSENLLIDALSFTEAEKRALEESADNLREFTVESMKRSNIKEVVTPDYGEFFKVKIQYSAIDDDSEREKKINTYILFGVPDCEGANDAAKDHLKEMLVPYEILSITRTTIAGVINHKP